MLPLASICGSEKKKSELLWNMSQRAKPNGHIYQARIDLKSVFED